MDPKAGTGGLGVRAENIRMCDSKGVIHEGRRGEVQGRVALDTSTLEGSWPQMAPRGEPNVFVFPNLSAANTAYQLLSRLGSIEVIGPVLLGLQQPITVIPPNRTVEDLTNLAALTALHSITLSGAQ